VSNVVRRHLGCKGKREQGRFPRPLWASVLRSHSIPHGMTGR
jgi:hypothetical protein